MTLAENMNSTKQGNPSRLFQLRALLLGFSGSGKRSSQKTILNQQSQGRSYNKVQAEVAGQQVIVVDTPGWDNKLSPDTAPRQILKEIEYGISWCHPGPHAILLVVNADTRFSEECRGHFEEYVQLLGETVWNHAMVLFTYGGCLRDTTIEEHIEREGEPLRWLVEKCGSRYHVLDNRSRGEGGTQVMELLEKIEWMVVRGGEEYFKYVRQGKDGSEIVEVDTEAEQEDGESRSVSKHPLRKINSQGLNRPSLSDEDAFIAEFLASSVSCSSPTRQRRYSSGYESSMSPSESLGKSVFKTETECPSHGSGRDSS